MPFPEFIDRLDYYSDPEEYLKTKITMDELRKQRKEMHRKNQEFLKKVIENQS